MSVADPRSADATPLRRALPTGPAAWRATVVATIAVGTVLRVLAYSDRRSLWFDEVMLSLNVATRSCADLTRPLDYGQAAPVLFLCAQRLAVTVGGVNELALRAIPLACGLALLPLLWMAGRLLLGEREALVALVLAALSPPLVYYSSEAKQYSGDACATALLLWLAARVLRDPRDPAAWRWLALGGVASLALSQPAVFVLAAIMVALLLASGPKEKPELMRRRLSPTAALWAATFLVLYVAVYRAAATPYMLRVWGETFLSPTAPDPGARLYAAARAALVDGFRAPWPRPAPRLVVAACLGYAVGIVSVWRRRGPPVVALLTLPLAGALAASTLALYPIGARVLLFCAPPVFLAYGAALAGTIDAVLPDRDAGRRGARVPAFVAAVVLLAEWRLRPAWADASHPLRREDAREIVAGYVRRASSDPVYVLARAVPNWAFYTTDWHAPDRARLAWMARLALPTSPAFENAPSRGRPVGREGDALVYAARGRRELIGIPSGMEWHERVEWLRPRPDSGWAANEARRVREAATSARGYTWLFLTHYVDVQRDELLEAIRRAGGRVVFLDQREGAVLYRVRFDDVPR
ncbi:MAG: glycosyltransferase family 39 protein [Gemmatimonadaceae bacterium]